jgi:two-component system response regulator (stage 0 sporulation protein A)
MDKDALIIERRGVWLGEMDDYAEALQAELSSVGKLHFKLATDAKELTKLLYEYEPMLILCMMDLKSIPVLLKVCDLTKYKQAVSVGLVYVESDSMRSFSERSIVTDVVGITGNAHGDAFDVIHSYNHHMKYGINLKTVSKRTPVSTDLVWHDVKADERRLRKAMSDKLERLGIRSELAGHQYLIAAIAMQSVTHMAPKPAKIYENVAEYYDVTPSAVEKAIRYAIENAWTVGDIDYQHELFGMSIDEEKGKPTNAEFIARLAIDF